jgi:aldose 1-epimerase
VVPGMSESLSRRNVLKGAAAAGVGTAAAVAGAGSAGATSASGSKTGAHPDRHHSKLKLSKDSFGVMADGTEVDRYTFGTDRGLQVAMITYGAAISQLLAPDRHGHRADVVLGLSTLEEYVEKSPYFGATIGRYANRIAKGTFVLDGTTYHIPINNDPNALHGGPEGFNTKVWDAVEVHEPHRVGVKFSYVSVDGEMGFPGTLSVDVTYTVNDCGELTLEYHASTDKNTVVNLTNHSYFNLAGEGQDTVYGHEVILNADSYTPIDATSIPLGPQAAVAGTPFDFRRKHTIGERIRVGTEQILNAHGYDHNWVLNPARHGLTKAAWVRHPGSGRVLECFTDQPGVQFYSGNFLDGTLLGRSGHVYRQGDAFTLETQHYPDSPNQASYPTTELEPGASFDSTTVFRFSAGH